VVDGEGKLGRLFFSLFFIQLLYSFILKFPIRKLETKKVLQGKILIDGRRYSKSIECKMNVDIKAQVMYIYRV